MAINEGSAETTLSTTQSNTETNLSTTSEQAPKKMGRPARASNAPVPWSVRGWNLKPDEFLRRPHSGLGRLSVSISMKTFVVLLKGRLLRHSYPLPQQIFKIR